jgi:hypothetical protein
MVYSNVQLKSRKNMRLLVETKLVSSKFRLVMGFSFDKIRAAIYEDLIFYTNNVGQMTKSRTY